MYSYVMEFNLGRRGEETQEYLTDVARTWPELWEQIPGVTGTLLLCSAFGLGGEFEFQWRVDFDKLSTLSRIGEAFRSSHDGWRHSRGEWFKHRRAVRAHLSGHRGGNKEYCHAHKGKEGAIHVIVASPYDEADRSARHLDEVAAVSGVISVQALRPIVGSAASHEQIWLRLDGLDSLDNVAAVERGIEHGLVFGEMRELDGSLFTGA